MRCIVCNECGIDMEMATEYKRVIASVFKREYLLVVFLVSKRVHGLALNKTNPSPNAWCIQCNFVHYPSVRFCNQWNKANNNERWNVCMPIACVVYKQVASDVLLCSVCMNNIYVHCILHCVRNIYVQYLCDWLIMAICIASNEGLLVAEKYV